MTSLRVLIPAVLATASLAAATPAGASSGHHCGDVKARRGGRAVAIYGNRVRCHTARAVARHANGHRYHSHGFKCTQVSGLYSCYEPGTDKGIGFNYDRT